MLRTVIGAMGDDAPVTPQTQQATRKSSSLPDKKKRQK
jgi:hypothetical protein